jgi:hypothetical protein
MARGSMKYMVFKVHSKNNFIPLIFHFKSHSQPKAKISVLLPLMIETEESQFFM